VSIGKDLLDVPFDSMVFSLAAAIAKGQVALDKASLATMKALAHQKFDWIPDVVETLSPGDVTTTSGGVSVTGVKTEFQAARPVQITMLQAGLFPQFYQFTETLIEVKMSLSQKTTHESSFDLSSSLDISSSVSGSVGFLFASGNFSQTVAFSSSVDYKTSSTYSYSAEGSSLLRTTLKPVPPPSRVMPRYTTVNALKSPPEVTVS
jgi:hypothetical protein